VNAYEAESRRLTRFERTAAHAGDLNVEVERRSLEYRVTKSSARNQGAQIQRERILEAAPLDLHVQIARRVRGALEAGQAAGSLLRRRSPEKCR